MKTPWYYTINQFMVRTVDNFRKTMELTKYHRAALNEMATTYPLDTDYGVMLARYTPAHQQFMAAYTRLNMANGALKGSSLAMRQQLTELRKLAQQWWVRAQAAGFGRDSDELEAMFPRGLKPFSNGAIDDKIANVNVLAKSMQPHAVLDALRLEITAYYTLLAASRADQLGKKSSKISSSAQVLEAQKVVMREQYRNVGRLMEKFAETPESITPFFNVQVLRQR